MLLPITGGGREGVFLKYFLIAGEASGDLHASRLIAALRERDPEAQFRFYGGDLMEAAATAPAHSPSAHGTSPLLRHYKTLAYMGFVQVALHARTILRGIADCKRAIAEWAPDSVILVDYPGFNLKIARWVSRNYCKAAATAQRPAVIYYISPKIWAWKEHRIKDIRAYVDRLFSILPFEVDFFEKKHHYAISYVGNPTYDEVAAYLAERGEDITDVATFGQQAEGRPRLHITYIEDEIGLDRSTVDTPLPPAIHSRSLIALLPGSRKAEIRSNLHTMLNACDVLHDLGIFDLAIAAAPGIDDTFYNDVLRACRTTGDVQIVRGHTYDLLRRASAALVTSGTATLEAALLDVPQVVCYSMRGGRCALWAKRHLLKCRYISLVNLIADAEVVPELIAADMNTSNVSHHLHALVAKDLYTYCQTPTPANTHKARTTQLEGYALVRQRLAASGSGAPQRAADEIVALLKARQ